MPTFRNRARRYIKRQYRRGKKWLKNRYYPGGKLKVRRIAKDVAFLKNLVNVEKKYVTFTVGDSFGQANNLAKAHYITPLISLAQGTTASTRNGNSVRATSLQWTLRMRGQTNLSSDNNWIMYIVMHKNSLPEDSYTTGSGGTLANLFLQDDYWALLSTHSFRNVEHFRDWIVLRRVRGSVKADASSTAGNYDHSINGYVKLHKHMRFDGANTTCIENQLYAIFVAANGDIQAGALTGLTFNLQYRFHYIDN